MPKITNQTPGVGKLGGTWRARYRGDDGRERSKVFRTKQEAVLWRTTALADRARGDWIDPRGGSTDVATLATVWLKSKVSRKPSNVADSTELWESHIKPDWGDRKIHSIKPSEVSTWLADLQLDGQSPSRLRKLALSLRQILQIAVRDNKLARNPVGPTKELGLPKLPDPDPKPLSRDEFGALLEAVSAGYRPLAEALVLTGMRIGEAAALRVSDVSLAGEKPYVRVSRGVVALSERFGGVQEGTTKADRARIVPLTPRGVQVFTHAVRGKRGTDLVFVNRDGGQVRARPYRSVLLRASVKAGLRPVAPHDLRDTFASWAIRTRRPVDVSGRAGAHARLRCAPVGAGLWLIISRGGRSSTVVIPDSVCEEVADALANASALAQIPDVADRAEWPEIHRSISAALDALLRLGLGTSYLRGVLP